MKNISQAKTNVHNLHHYWFIILVGLIWLYRKQKVQLAFSWAAVKWEQFVLFYRIVKKSNELSFCLKYVTITEDFMALIRWDIPFK